MFDENTISANVEVGRGYRVTAYKYDDDMDKAKIVLRNNTEMICILYTWCYNIEWHLDKASKIMKRIMHLLDAIEQNTNDKNMLIEWADDTMKYWGNKIYDILYDEFGYILQGKDLKTNVAENLQDLKDGYLEVYVISKGLDATYSVEFGKFTITHDIAFQDDKAERHKDIYIYSSLDKCTDIIMEILDKYYNKGVRI